MQTFSIRKPAVRSRHGLVAAQNRHAAEAGAAVLSRGGNAMDAAIVTALVLSVVEPWLSGIGGGGFLLRADGESGQIDTLDFNVRSASALDAEDYPLAGGSAGNWFDWPSVEADRNVSGYFSICVPSAIAGFASALERFGSISWEEALRPAIDHAERGLEIDWFASLGIASEAATLAHHPVAAGIFLDSGAPPRAGERGERIFRRMPAKAATLKRLARAGARDFYEGEIAASLARELAEGGSAVSARDLAAYRAEWRPPLRTRYRDFEICAMGGLSGGPSFVACCDALRQSAISPAMEAAETSLLYATVIRDAYEHRLTRMGHAAIADAGCTSHVSVVDARGTMVSLTNTLLSRFGSRVALPSTGFLLNNGMMWFDPRPGQPNGIAAGMKPLANMCPVIALRDGRPALAIGAAGGRTIFPTVLQILSYLADFGLSLEEAFHRPRIDASAPTIKINTAAQAAVAATVASRFPVEIVEDTLFPVNFAVPCAVMRAPDGGEFSGMAHPASPWAAVAAASAPLDP